MASLSRIRTWAQASLFRARASASASANTFLHLHTNPKLFTLYQVSALEHFFHSQPHSHKILPR